MSGPEIGGPIAVDTAEMRRAAGVLAEAQSALRAVAARVGAAERDASPRRLGALRDAGDHLATAQRQADAACDGLRIAADRYGGTEHLVAQGQQTLFAGAAAVEGAVVRTGPLGATVAIETDLAVSGGFLAWQALGEWIRTGHVDLQSDPEVVRWVQLRISSLDDSLRGFAGVETPRDLLVDDPGSPFGTEAIGAALSAIIWPSVRKPLEVRRTVSQPVARPASLAELADRLPDGAKPEGQVRIERYEDAGDPRWIVYSAGTVTFDRDSGSEPFDLESDVRGVAAQPTDAQAAVLTAMRQAGIGAGDPVLMVGHSQGALNVMRIAEQGHYDVQGVVEFGGPTEQIAAPTGTEVLQVVHAQDLVPALGGVAAAGAGTVTVRRSLAASELVPGTSGTAIDCFPAHAMEQYRRTVAEAEALDDPRITGLRRRWSGFFAGGAGESARYRAWRPGSAPPVVSPPGRCR